MPEIQLPLGNSLNYLDDHPDGYPVVVLLHGLGASGESWQLQISDLADAGYRPVAPDMPGYGASRYGGRGWSIRAMAGVLDVLLDRLGCQSAHLVGISMGGTVALQAALDLPARIERLVLINTFASLRPDRLAGWAYLLRRFWTFQTRGKEEQALLVANRIFPGPDKAWLRDELIREIARADPRAYRATMIALGLFDVRRRLDEVRAPTLVITGDRDTTVPLANQRLLAERIPAARQVLVKDAGHAATVDQPAEVNRAILTHLQDRAIPNVISGFTSANRG